MSNCDCPSGKYGCSCCCASVTGLRAGIHPDYINSMHFDLIINDETDQTFQIRPLISTPIHIVSVTASLACVSRNETHASDGNMKKQIVEPTRTEVYKGWTPVMFSLFTIPSWTDAALAKGGFNPHDDSQDGRTYISTGSVTGNAPSWQSPSDLFGYFCDGGLYVELNAPNREYGVRIVVNYIDRSAFSPAYGDPVAVLQHYWSCAHGDVEFLHGFYGGNTFRLSSSASASFDSSTGGSAESETEANPWMSTGWSTVG